MEEQDNSGLEENQSPKETSNNIHAIPVSGMFENWFLDYASYVILERAVPAINDGLKPVQRRALHSMKELDDGRFNKVANVIGHTMQYHPHGDAAIGDAIVNLGQKDLLIETQGNWGDVRTGDSAAAPRYIEARLSKFALEVAFNPDTTEWQVSYDGRKKEPVTLPMKFPMLLAQGVEGIAVGLSTKIMPHNFIELCKGSISVLKEKSTKLLPDFPTGGLADFSDYNRGERGGKIRVRSKIEVVDKKTLAIKSVPYGTTTTGLIDSIVKANDNGKIKIKQVVDNTAKDVEIFVHIAPGISPDVTLDALYAFTDCEVSISPNTCVIVDEKPAFMNVDEVLKISTEKTKTLLKRELEIKKAALEEKWHFSSLEKIFIENRIYRDIEECETWEAVIEAIDKGLEPHKKKLKREVTQEDIVRLTEIKIKRISKYDSFKADEYIKDLEEKIAEVEHHLKHLTEFAIAYFEKLIEKYGKGRERKTEIATFETIKASRVAVSNRKLYVNRREGFIGYGLKKDEYVCDCSDLDLIIAFRRDGKFMVSKVSDKSFFGKDIIHVAVWKKGDDRMVYNMIYADPKMGKSFAKRFSVTSITRDKEYDLTTGNPETKVVYFTANPNSESEVVGVTLSPSSKAKKKQFEYDFGELAIKGRGSRGNVISKYAISKVTRKELGESTIGGRDIWIDKTVGRLNTEERGDYLGSFDTDDQILCIYKDGSYDLTEADLVNHYNVEEIEIIEKFNPEGVISALYLDGKLKKYFIKRFQVETKTTGEQFVFISEESGSKLLKVSTAKYPILNFEYNTKAGGDKKSDEIDMVDFIDVKGWKAMGNRLKYHTMSKVTLSEVEKEVAGEDGSTGTSNEESNEKDQPDLLNKDTKGKEESSKTERVSKKDDEELEEDTPSKEDLEFEAQVKKELEEEKKQESENTLEWTADEKVPDTKDKPKGEQQLGLF